MKSKFPGHFQLTEDERKDLWKNALFTLDANILLNLYRYSDTTREEFFKILKKIKDRIWIPHQSAQEFFNNRLDVISQQEKSYEETISSLKEIEEKFHNSRQHPFLDEKLLKEFTSLNKEICEQLEKNKKPHNDRITKDDIIDKIKSLFDKKVGNEFTEEELQKIYEEGASRFKNKTPPGYKDSSKKDNTETEEELQKIYEEGESRFKNKTPPGYKDSSKKDNTELNSRKYGDFIIWKQIIQQSKDLKKGIIFVTDDKKEDWWVRYKGKTISPRPELIKEFQSATEQSFHMYPSDRFLEFARDFLNEEVDEKAIEEIRELRRSDEKASEEIRELKRMDGQRRMKLRKEEEYRKYQFQKSLMEEIIRLEEELNVIDERKNHLKNLIDEQYLILDKSDSDEYEERKLSRFKHELKILNSKSDEIRRLLMFLTGRGDK